MRTLWDRSLRSALLLAALVVVPGIAGAAPLRVRQNVDELMKDPEAYGNFLHALKVLKTQPAYDNLVKLHNDEFVGPCEHGSELFLPWHRAVLLRFEDALRAADPPRTANVTLPYWDWSKPPSGKRYPRAVEDPVSPLYHENRNASGDPLPDPEEIRQILRIENFPDFGGKSPAGYGELESSPHNYMHNDYVGGDMRSDTTAAVDPLFWLFHAYIDLLWAEWQKTHTGQPACLDCELRGMQPAQVGWVIDTRRLGYVYDMTHSADLAGGGRLGQLAAARTAAAPLVLPLTLPADGFVAARIRFAEVKTASRSYRADLYLHPPDVAYRPGDADFARRYHAGYFSIWGSSRSTVPGHAGHHPPTASLSADVTAALRQAVAAAPGAEWRLTVVFHAAPGEESTARLDFGDEVSFNDVSLVLEDY